MAHKLRPKNMQIANQWQADQMTKLDTKGEFTGAVEAAMEDIGAAVKRHDDFTVALVCMGLLDGAECEGPPGLRETIKEWHKRAVMGKRSWEAS